MPKFDAPVSWIVLGIFFAVGLYYTIFLTPLSANSAMKENITAEDIIIPNQEIPEDASVATFAGGCFWCIESAFEGQPGVYEAISGYAGGDESDASYMLVSKGTTDHKEAAQVYYDPEVTTYKQLLEIFWRQIDPTDDEGQFADRGPQYRTAIFYHNEAEEKAAEASKETLNQSGKFEEPIATEILPFTTFFEAEEKHQNFAKKQAEYYKRYKKGSGRTGYIEETWGETEDE